MENFNHQGIWLNILKRIADPKLKAEDCKSSAAAANIIGTYLDEQGVTQSDLDLATKINSLYRKYE